MIEDYFLGVDHFESFLQIFRIDDSSVLATNDGSGICYQSLCLSFENESFQSVEVELEGVSIIEGTAFDFADVFVVFVRKT
jgi:hypothetical protein